MQRGEFRSWTSGERFFRCAVESETFMKRHVDRTCKSDPGDMRFSTTTNRACAGTYHSVHLRSLRVGDPGWPPVRVRVASDCRGEYKPSEFQVSQVNGRVSSL
jgi:hypothetical protein